MYPIYTPAINTYPYANPWQYRPVMPPPVQSYFGYGGYHGYNGYNGMDRFPAMPRHYTVYRPATGISAAASLPRSEENLLEKPQPPKTGMEAQPPTQPRKRQPEIYFYSPGKTLSYSDLDELIDNNLLKRVVIEIDPKSFTALPKAELTLADRTKQTILLPRDLRQVTQTLTDAQVDFTFAPVKETGGGLQAVKGILEELLLPTLLLAATGALGIGMMGWWQNWQKNKEIEESLSKAHKTFDDVKYTFEETLPELDRPVKNALLSFLNDESDVLVIKGLPGVGKTHSLLAMCHKILKEESGVFFLEIGPGAGDEVRELVRQIYSGDKKLALKALKKLQRENGGQPVKELILYADEIEKIPGDLLEFVINNGIGNPVTKVENLPALRLIGSCNYWPAFLSNQASSSRSEAVLFNPFPPEKVEKVFAKELARQFPGKLKAGDVEAVAGPLFEEFPGYSNRTIAKVIVRKVTNQLRQSQDFKPESIRKILNEVLESRPLNNTEIAALSVQMLLDKVQNGRQPLAEGGEENLWMLLTDAAEEASQDLNFYLKANGRQYKRMIGELLKDQPLDYVEDPQALEKAVQAVGKGLRTRRIQALRFEHPQLGAEQKLAHELLSYMQEILDKANQTQEDASRDENFARFQKAVKAIRNAPRDSALGQILRESAKIYRALEAIDPEEDAALDRQKLDAVFNAAVLYNPADHNESNNFHVYPDPLYQHLFYNLRKLILTASGK